MSTLRVNVNFKHAGMIEKSLAKHIKVAANKGLKVAARQSIAVLVARTVDAPPAAPESSPFRKPGADDQHSVRGGWEIDPEPRNMQLVIFNRALHAKYVEQGVKGNTGKLGPLARDLIEQWVQRKGIVIVYQGRTLTSKQAARQITRAINKRTGWRFKPRKIVERSQVRIREIFKKQLDTHMEKAVEAAARGR